MLIVTTENISGRRIEKVIGLVFGVSVRSRNAIGDWLGGFKTILGGKQSGYADMITQNRIDAMKDMIEHAKQHGANAIIMSRFDSNEFGGGRGHALSEVIAYGTAVIVREE